MNDMREELAAEQSRDHWLAASCAQRLAAGEPLQAIELEAREALENWLAFENQDTRRRSHDRQRLLDETNPF